MSETRDYRLKQRQAIKGKYAEQLEYEKMLHSLNNPGKDAYELQGDVFNRDLCTKDILRSCSVKIVPISSFMAYKLPHYMRFCIA